MRIIILCLGLLVFETNTLASCELSDEYLKARKEVGQMVYGNDNDYRKCQNSASNYDFWKAMAKCTESGGGKDIAGGCAHLVGEGGYLENSDSSHCEVFKFDPTPKLAQSLLDEIVAERQIVKCKK